MHTLSNVPFVVCCWASCWVLGITLTAYKCKGQLKPEAKLGLHNLAPPVLDVLLEPQAHDAYMLRGRHHSNAVLVRRSILHNCHHLLNCSQCKAGATAAKPATEAFVKP